jgi:predicted dehydrogenase
MHTVRVPGRYYITQEQMFVDMVENKECQHLPTVADGIKCQKILDSLLESSEKNMWIDL